MNSSQTPRPESFRPAGRSISWHPILLWSLLACLLGGDSACCAEVGAGRRPNVVFLLTDDQRYDALGCNGSKVIQTPNIDSLATAGVAFDRAFVTTSICVISRASILTGQYSLTHGIHKFGTQQLSPQQLDASYLGRLKEAGYCIGFVGKWGIGNPPKGFFDYNGGYKGQGAYYNNPGGKHLTTMLADQASEFIDSCSPDQPFCLSVSFKAPHVDQSNLDTLPFNHDHDFDELYEDISLPTPALSSDEFFRSQPKFLRESENRIRWRHRFATPANYQQSVKGYYRLITGVDRAVGRLIEQLRQAGLDDSTVIVFSSDHGFYLGERGFAGKWYAHELSIHVPLIVFDPRLPTELRGRRVNAMALNIDIAPTLLDLADVSVPKAYEGSSLLPLVRGETPSDWREDFYYEHDFEYATIPRSEAVRTDRFKYVVYPEVSPVYEELYDLQRDLDEARNLATDPSFSAEVEAMRRLLALRKSELVQAE